MKEIKYPTIEIVGQAPKKRNYCYSITDECLREDMLTFLRLERIIENGNLTREEWGTAMVVHMRF